jgi:hypothetical protein
VSRWPSFLLLVVLVAFGASCSPCTSATTAVTQPDGGPVRCVTAEDCPRTGNDLVCVISSPADYTSTCVSCVSTQCMQVAVSCP